MAKEFKNFDIKYGSYKNKLLDNERIDKTRIAATSNWEYADNIKSWTQEEIFYAVYNSATAEDWQKFRVSLKGQSTRLKLVRLAARYRRYVLGGYDCKDLEQCRIDNYIGALVRGGQLDKEYNVKKEY